MVAALQGVMGGIDGICPPLRGEDERHGVGGVQASTQYQIPFHRAAVKTKNLPRKRETPGRKRRLLATQTGKFAVASVSKIEYQGEARRERQANKLAGGRRRQGLVATQSHLSYGEGDGKGLGEKQHPAVLGALRAAAILGTRRSRLERHEKQVSQTVGLVMSEGIYCVYRRLDLRRCPGTASQVTQVLETSSC